MLLRSLAEAVRFRLLIAFAHGPPYPFRMRFASALTLVFLATGACSLFTSLDGLSGGNNASDAGGAGDGSIGSDAAPKEAGATCDGGLTACGNACIDPSGDALNCGTCGHDCLGSGCFGGQCQPVVIATGQDGAYDIAVGGGEAYWPNQNSGEIVKCTTSNCAGTITVLASGRPSPEDIVIDDTNVYWSEQGGAAFCARAGCGGHPTALVSGMTTADGGALDYDGIAVGPSLIYFPLGGSLRGCTKTGCGNSPSTLTVANADDLTSDANNLYGADGDDIFACPLGNCSDATRVQLVSNVSGSESVAVDTINVYFSYGGAVGSCPLTGCATPTVLADNQTGPDDVATDGVNVYWTDNSADVVLRCAVGGCADKPTVLAKDQHAPKGIALDANAVYWTQVSGDAIVRLAK